MPVADPKTITHILLHFRERKFIALYRKIDGMKIGESGRGQFGPQCIECSNPNKLDIHIYIDFEHAEKALQELAHDDARHEVSRKDGRAHECAVFEDVEGDSRIVTPGPQPGRRM
jgi:hypothetical protein